MDHCATLLILIMLSVASAKDCAEMEHKSMQHRFNECTTNYHYKLQETLHTGKNIENLICEHFTQAVNSCGEVLEMCHDQDNIRRMKENLIADLILVGGQYSYGCDVVVQYRKLRGQGMEKMINGHSWETCTESNLQKAKQEMSKCSHSAAITVHSNIENITDSSVISNLLCNALAVIGTDCFKDLRRCLSSEDVSKMRINQLKHMKAYLLQLAEGKVGNQSLEICQLIETEYVDRSDVGKDYTDSLGDAHDNAQNIGGNIIGPNDIYNYDETPESNYNDHNRDIHDQVEIQDKVQSKENLVNGSDGNNAKINDGGNNNSDDTCTESKLFDANKQMSDCSYQAASEVYSNIIEAITPESISNIICDALTIIATDCVNVLHECYSSKDISQMKKYQLKQMKNYLLRTAAEKVNKETLGNCLVMQNEFTQTNNLEKYYNQGNQYRHSQEPKYYGGYGYMAQNKTGQGQDMGSHEYNSQDGTGHIPPHTDQAMQVHVNNAQDSIGGRQAWIHQAEKVNDYNAQGNIGNRISQEQQVSDYDYKSQDHNYMFSHDEHDNELCSETNLQYAHQQMGYCSRSAAIRVHSDIQNITDSSIISDIICEALTVIGTDCVKILDYCFSAQDINELRFNQLQHWKNYLIGVASGKQDFKLSLKTCQGMEHIHTNIEENVSSINNYHENQYTDDHYMDVTTNPSPKKRQDIPHSTTVQYNAIKSDVYSTKRMDEEDNNEDHFVKHDKSSFDIGQEMCTQTKLQDINKDITNCSHHAAINAHSSIENINDPFIISDILCNALTTVATDCVTILYNCFFHEDAFKMKINRLEQMKKYLLQLVEGRIDNQSLENCQAIKTNNVGEQEKPVRSQMINKVKDDYDNNNLHEQNQQENLDMGNHADISSTTKGYDENNVIIEQNPNENDNNIYNDHEICTESTVQIADDHMYNCTSITTSKVHSQLQDITDPTIASNILCSSLSVIDRDCVKFVKKCFPPEYVIWLAEPMKKYLLDLVVARVGNISLQNCDQRVTYHANINVVESNIQDNSSKGNGEEHQGMEDDNNKEDSDRLNAERDQNRDDHGYNAQEGSGHTNSQDFVHMEIHDNNKICNDLVDNCTRLAATNAYSQIESTSDPEITSNILCSAITNIDTDCFMVAKKCFSPEYVSWLVEPMKKYLVELMAEKVGNQSLNNCLEISSDHVKGDVVLKNNNDKYQEKQDSKKKGKKSYNITIKKNKMINQNKQKYSSVDYPETKQGIIGHGDSSTIQSIVGHEYNFQDSNAKNSTGLSMGGHEDNSQDGNDHKNIQERQNMDGHEYNSNDSTGKSKDGDRYNSQYNAKDKTGQGMGGHTGQEYNDKDNEDSDDDKCSESNIQRDNQDMIDCTRLVASNVYVSFQTITHTTNVSGILCNALTTIGTDCVKVLEKCFADEDVRMRKNNQLEAMKNYLLKVAVGKVDKESLENCSVLKNEKEEESLATDEVRQEIDEPDSNARKQAEVMTVLVENVEDPRELEHKWYNKIIEDIEVHQELDQQYYDEYDEPNTWHIYVGSNHVPENVHITEKYEEKSDDTNDKINDWENEIENKIYSPEVQQEKLGDDEKNRSVSVTNITSTVSKITVTVGGNVTHYDSFRSERFTSNNECNGLIPRITTSIVLISLFVCWF